MFFLARLIGFAARRPDFVAYEQKDTNQLADECLCHIHSMLFSFIDIVIFYAFMSADFF